VLPLEPIKGGFMGMNFHYLSPVMRFRLLQTMDKFKNRNDLTSATRFDVNYNDVRRIPMVKPTIKKYLFQHLMSNFLRIDAQEAAIAVYLPVQQFKKRSASFVYGRSRSIIGS
jgi:hypothetical protein